MRVLPWLMTMMLWLVGIGLDHGHFRTRLRADNHVDALLVEILDSRQGQGWVKVGVVHIKTNLGVGVFGMIEAPLLAAAICRAATVFWPRVDHEPVSETSTPTRSSRSESCPSSFAAAPKAREKGEIQHQNNQTRTNELPHLLKFSPAANLPHQICSGGSESLYIPEALGDFARRSVVALS